MMIMMMILSQMANMDRATADALMLREKVTFEVIEEEPRKKRKKDKKKDKRKSEKRGKLAPDEDGSDIDARIEVKAVEKVFMGWRSPAKGNTALPSEDSSKKRKREEMEEGEEPTPELVAAPVAMITLGLKDLPGFLADRFYSNMLDWIQLHR
jgi:hypothetical protein